jgi:hypothetical protein
VGNIPLVPLVPFVPTVPSNRQANFSQCV